MEDYRKQYNKGYYDFWKRRFYPGSHGIFSIYFQKFDFKEPILDMGCGTGLFMEEALSRGFKNVIGLEVSEYAVRQAKEKELNVFLYDGRHIPFESDFFGSVFCYQVIEHIPREDADFLLGECYRVLKPRGNFLLFAPAEYAKVYDTDETHINYYKISEFLSVVEKLGFKIKSFYSTMLLPRFLRSIPVFSYILAKFLYKITKTWGTSLELEAYK